VIKGHCRSSLVLYSALFVRRECLSTAPGVALLGSHNSEMATCNATSFGCEKFEKLLLANVHQSIVHWISINDHSQIIRFHTIINKYSLLLTFNQLKQTQYESIRTRITYDLIALQCVRMKQATGKRLTQGTIRSVEYKTLQLLTIPPYTKLCRSNYSSSGEEAYII